VIEPVTDFPGVLLINNLPRHSGIGEYTHMLADGLRGIGLSTGTYEWRGVWVEKLYDLLWGRVPIRYNYNPFAYVEQGLRVVGQVRHFDRTPSGRGLYHITSPALARVAAKRHPSIVTIHDMVPFTQPRFLTDRLIRRSMRSAQDADRIICVSQFTRSELFQNLDVAPSEVSVVPLGVSHDVFQPGDKLRARAALGLPLHATIVLHVGSEEPRKNIPSILHAFAGITTQVPNALLVRVGGAVPATLRLIAQLGLEKRVMHLRALPTLGDVYRAADVLCFPSFQEGFGLPALEAMASGCPVVGSDRSAIPEIVGDAGALVNPEDVGALTNALVKVLEDSEYREDLVRKGLARAAEFSWERCARETLAVYQQIVPELGPPATP
jgi:glycosyltransferase involved in cell wall biosynthesis